MIHFFHKPKFEVAPRIFRSRYNKIKWDNIYYKIDFNYFNSYFIEDIERWNQLKLTNSIAFFQIE
jgi:uncharacterized protein (DUF1919 family)